jgi:hypothetical protein
MNNLDGRAALAIWEELDERTGYSLDLECLVILIQPFTSVI